MNPLSSIWSHLLHLIGVLIVTASLINPQPVAPKNNPPTPLATTSVITVATTSAAASSPIKSTLSPLARSKPKNPTSVTVVNQPAAVATTSDPDLATQQKTFVNKMSAIYSSFVNTDLAYYDGTKGTSDYHQINSATAGFAGDLARANALAATDENLGLEYVTGVSYLIATLQNCLNASKAEYSAEMTPYNAPANEPDFGQARYEDQCNKSSAAAYSFILSHRGTVSAQ